MRFLLLAFLISSPAHAWTAQKSVSALDDSVSFELTQKSRAVVWGGKKAELSLTILCESGERVLRIYHPWVTGSSSIVDVDLRFDKEKALTVQGFPHGEYKSITVKLLEIESLSNHQTLIAVYPDVTGALYGAEFSLKGFAAAYAKVKCPKVAV
jgi:hypothetical protein